MQLNELTHGNILLICWLSGPLGDNCIQAVICFLSTICSMEVLRSNSIPYYIVNVLKKIMRAVS